MSSETRNIKEQSKLLSQESSKPESIQLESTESACPSCSHKNDNFSSYCGECGVALQSPSKCTRCNATTQPRADICEVCGTWLLKGQCMFCYAHVDENQAFCGECGNSTSGIPCPQCGNLSIFDFCKSCGIPLSIQAKEMVKETARNPLFQEMASLIEQLDSSPSSVIGSTPIKTGLVTAKKETDDQVLRLKEYRESLTKPATQHTQKSVPNALFSKDQRERISRLNEEVAQEEECRRIEEERRRQEEEKKRREAEERRMQEEARQRKLQVQINNEMSKLRGKTFSSNQEARRFFMSIIAGLPEEVARNITDKGMGWRCNAYDCVHDSPGDCADPSRGGVWLIR